MPTNLELEKRVVDLENQLNDAMDAIRRLAGEQTSQLTIISKHEETIADLKTELERVKITSESKKVAYDTGISRYE